MNRIGGGAYLKGGFVQFILNEFIILLSFLLPEASVDCGTVILLGAPPDHMIHLYAARPMLSFSHSQKVLFSKSQPPPLTMKKTREHKKHKLTQY